jgi:hypothetical protein
MTTNSQVSPGCNIENKGIAFLCPQPNPEMIHDADLEDEKFDRKEAAAIDLLLKGFAHIKKSSDEILAAGISAVEALFHVLQSGHL